MPRAAKPTPPQPGGQPFVWNRLKGGRDVPALYANAIQVVVSEFDIVLVMGQISFADDGEPEMREVGRLSLSPAHARALGEVLSKRVGDYEAHFGTIGGPQTSGSPPPS